MEQEKNQNGYAVTIEVMLLGIYKNQLVLAEACGVKLPYTPALDEWDNINKVCQINSGCLGLPVSVARRIRNKDAWDKAVKQSFVSIGDDGCLKWELGTKTLLAYFLGRVFCGDKPKWSKRSQKFIWEQGDGEFPGTDMERLFGMCNLKVLRKKTEKCSIPKGAETIDNLFVTH